MSVDAATAEAVAAMREGGLRPILLKGPALGRWLYESQWERPYGDADLLVSPADFDSAAKILTDLGYRSRLPDRWFGVVAIESLVHAQAFHRDGAWPTEVDLHRTLPHIPPDVGSWKVLACRSESIDVGGGPVDVLRPGARALLVGLHAAHHGSGVAKPLRDVERALQVIDDSVWREAASLARQLDVAEAFAAGLHFTAAGRELADRMGLPTPTSTNLRLRMSGDTVVAEAVRCLKMQEPPLRHFLLLLGRIFPSPAWIRQGYPAARRGRVALARGYLRRWIVLTSKIPQVLAAARAARAERSGHSGRA